MFGSLLGNVVGIGYFLAFQILGVILALLLFQKEKLSYTVLMGSVFGSFGVHWLPTLFAFVFNFTVRAHILSLFVMILLVIAVQALCKGRTIMNGRKFEFKPIAVLKENPALFLILPLFIFVVMTLLHHTISYVDGAMYSGQSTYGDMNMHLGFITSITNQKTFPPEYSILPGTKLAYPFLSDSISSSLYIWGTSLRVAYLIPMFFALLQVFFGMYTLAKLIVKKRGKAFLAFALFFLNGGFGFLYFITQGFTSTNFTRIFTEFYQTPTNYVEQNIQWHNIICDMLIPQRATLFGWAMLFPILALLVKAMKDKNRSYFIIGGILAGGLPLIHTHSFLALGILCAGFVALQFFHHKQKGNEKRWPIWARLIAVGAFLGGMSIISQKQLSDKPWDANTILLFGILVGIAFVGILLYCVYKGFSKKILTNWGIFLILVLVCALPQLIAFTFRQAQGEQFVRGVFNWANTVDGYIVFYLKNLGIMFVLCMLLFVFGSKRQIQIALPAAFLWLISEFIVFQPNTYDNNKLLLVSYLFFSIAIADYVWDMAAIFSLKWIRITCVSLVTALAVFAAVLTMGREYVSDYQIYDSSYVTASEWVEENTEPDDVLLTATNHNNAIASLTGRNIVCGSSSFLYFHGVNYTQNEADVKTMYEDPTQRDALIEKYNVSYIVIGAYEQGSYSIPDLQAMLQNYEVEFNNGSVVILSV